MNREILNKIWELYRVFCQVSSQTMDSKSEMAPDFLGWLEERVERKEKGFEDGYHGIL